MTTQTANIKSEKEMEPFTASFLLGEFRKDIRSMHEEFRSDIRSIHDDMSSINNRIDGVNSRIDSTNSRIDATNNKIDNKFMWTIGVQVATLVTVIASILGVVLPIVIMK